MTFDFSKVHFAGQIMADFLAPLAIWHAFVIPCRHCPAPRLRSGVTALMLVSGVTALLSNLRHAFTHKEDAMPRHSATFEALEGDAGLYDCCICHKNPATLKCSGIRGGPCCLQCAFSVLAHLAEETVDQLAHLAS